MTLLDAGGEDDVGGALVAEEVAGSRMSDELEVLVDVGDILGEAVIAVADHGEGDGGLRAAGGLEGEEEFTGRMPRPAGFDGEFVAVGDFDAASPGSMSSTRVNAYGGWSP